MFFYKQSTHEHDTSHIKFTFRKKKLFRIFGIQISTQQKCLFLLAKIKITRVFFVSVMYNYSLFNSVASYAKVIKSHMKQLQTFYRISSFIIGYYLALMSIVIIGSNVQYSET